MPRLRPRVITRLDLIESETRAANTEPGTPSAPKETKEDGFIAKLIKYIPAEVIAAHQTLAGLYSPENAALVGWLTLVLLPFSPVWFFIGTKDPGEKPAWLQVVLCPIAFAIWMIVLKSPAVLLLFKKPLLSDQQGSIVLFFATLLIPVIEKLVVKLTARVA